MSKSNQTGFGAIEAILVLVIVAIIVFIGWFGLERATSTDHAATKTATQAKLAEQAPKQAGLQLSKQATFYDCMDAFGKHQSPTSNQPTDPAHYDRNDKTGDCMMNGKTYKFPTTFTDDNIRDISGFHISASEATYLRGVGQNNFKNCYNPPYMYGSIDIMGEEQGKYLYYGVDCDSGHREVAVQAGGAWKVVNSSSMGVECSTITKYNIPHSLFNYDKTHDGGAQCLTTDKNNPLVNIDSLK